LDIYNIFEENMTFSLQVQVLQIGKGRFVKQNKLIFVGKNKLASRFRRCRPPGGLWTGKKIKS
jgi:hypothetical protein